MNFFSILAQALLAVPPTVDETRDLIETEKSLSNILHCVGNFVEFAVEDIFEIMP